MHLKNLNHYKYSKHFRLKKIYVSMYMLSFFHLIKKSESKSSEASIGTLNEPADKSVLFCAMTTSS
jgi:hypothetical protein